MPGLKRIMRGPPVCSAPGDLAEECVLDGRRIGLGGDAVRHKLEWESAQLAKALRTSRLWGAERQVNRASRRVLAGRWATVPFERRCHDHRLDRVEAPPGEIGRSTPIV